MHRFRILFLAALIACGVVLGETAQAQIADVTAAANVTLSPIGSEFGFVPGTQPLTGAAGGVECGADPFRPTEDGFSFRSERTERACGTASWSLQVPGGAERVSVLFRADRQLETDSTAADARAVQDFAVYSRDRGTLLEQELFSANGPSDPGKAFEFVLPLAGEPDELTFSWGFQDGGAILLDAPVAVPAGLHFEASVAAVEIRVLGIDVLGLEVPGPYADRDSGASIMSLDVRFVLPHSWFDAWGNPHIEVAVLARGPYESAMLVLPNGIEMSSENLILDAQQPRSPPGAQDAAEVCRVIVPGALTSAGGSGEYLLRLQYQEPVTEIAGGILAGLGIVAVPSVLLALAVGATLCVLRVTQPVRRRRAMLTTGLVFALGILLLLSMRGGPAALGRRPVAPDAASILLVLVVVAALSLAVLLIAYGVLALRRRAETERMRQGLGRERRAREDAEEALYAVVHDLKTPLIALEYLMDDVAGGVAEKEQPVEAREAMRRSRDVIREMNQLVVEMLTFAKELGSVNGSGHVWVRPAVKEVVEKLRPRLATKGVRVVVPPGPDVCLLVPPESLRHTLHNLVENAIKYGPDVGGVVRVSVTPQQRRGRVGDLVVEVADNGYGIANEDRERVFRLLTRVPDRQGRILPGTGVGLAVVQRVVTAQGGRVEIDDAPEGGALFRITWPAGLVKRAASPVQDPGWEMDAPSATAPRPDRVGTGV